MTDYAKKIEELKTRIGEFRVLDSQREMVPLIEELCTLAKALLSELTAIRGAGDEEVRSAVQECYNCFGEIGRVLKSSPHLMKLEDIAISRGQQRDEALKRVGELEEEVERLRNPPKMSDIARQIEAGGVNPFGL